MICLLFLHFSLLILWVSVATAMFKFVSGISLNIVVSGSSIFLQRTEFTLLYGRTVLYSVDFGAVTWWIGVSWGAFIWALICCEWSVHLTMSLQWPPPNSVPQELGDTVVLQA